MTTRTTPMMNPSSSAVEIFEEDLKVNMRHLFNNVDELPESNQAFALSLCAYYDEHDRLSSKQMYHACKFWQWINANVSEAGGKVKPEPVPATIKQSDVDYFHRHGRLPTKDETPPRVVIDGSSLIKLFDKAFEGLKYPNVRYGIDIGWHGIQHSYIKFYRTGEMNRRYGAGCVACIFGDGDSKTILVMITRDGKTAFSQYCFDKPVLQQELKKIIESPVEAFKVNGQKYSHCCFCGQELNTKESVSAGYGPICASKYGLPWGMDSKEQTTLEDL